MATVKFKGTPVQTCGELPEPGTKAFDFILTTQELKDLSLKDIEGEKIVFNIFPSIDTDVCAKAVRRFNEEAAKLDNTKVIGVSKDLPFALERFCAAEGIENVIATSELRNQDFGEKYGVRLANGPLAGLLTRCVIILDEFSVIQYVQLVPEITDEPEYDEAIEALKKIK